MFKLKLMAGVVGVATWAFVAASCVIGDPGPADKVPANLPNRTPTHANLSYSPPGHSVVAARKLDLYLPPAGGASKPVIVWAHGGGWSGGDKADQYDNGEKRGAFKSILAQVSRGFAVASINYRLSTEAIFPAAVQDMKLAVRFLKANAGTYNLNANKVIVAGESAGAYLAALAAVSQGQFELSVSAWTADSSVAAVVDIVGPTDLQAFLAQSAWPHYAGTFLGCPQVNGVYQCSQQVLQQSKVATYLNAVDPPVFMAYGTADPLVAIQAQGRATADAWSAALTGEMLEDSGRVFYNPVSGGDHDLAKQTSQMSGITEEQRKTFHFTAMQQFLDNVAAQ